MATQTDGPTAVVQTVAGATMNHTVNMEHTANQLVKLSLTPDILKVPNKLVELAVRV